jgi:hypothetical protein
MIGGEHYFRANGEADHNLLNSIIDSNKNVEFFGSGRDSLYSVLKYLDVRHIFLPNLICESMYKAVVSLDIKCSFYGVDQDLKADVNFFNNEEVNSCILFVHFFGKVDKRAVEAARSRGLLIISDATHLLFNSGTCSDVALFSDYVFASLRKSGPFPDGGFLSSREKGLPRANRDYRREFVAYRVAGLLARGFAVNKGRINDENFKLLRTAEKLLDDSDAGTFNCSIVTQDLLETTSLSIQTPHIKNNLKFLYEHLNDLVNCANVDGAPSPYFVVLFQSLDIRDKVRENLARKKVFCPIHWETSFLNDPSSLSAIILSIPCDARYGLDEMSFIVEIIKDSL